MVKPLDELDELDLSILRLLQLNARISFSELARRTGVPEATVRYRIRKMVERGVIKGFYTLVEPSKVGFPFSVIVLAEVDPEELDNVFKSISEIPEVTHVFKLTGKHNIVAIFHARSMEHVSRIDEEIRSKRGVRSAETLLVTDRVHINLRMPI